MADNIKKVLLQKKVENTLYQILPKTDATIVNYDKTVSGSTTSTTVAAELAALAQAITDGDEAVKDLIYGLQDNETLQQSYDTIKEIGDFLATHEDSIGALAALIADVGKATEGSTAATGIHADIEGLDARVDALETAAGTNVSKTKSGSADASNGYVYLDGVLTAIYDDSLTIGASTDAANASGTTVWPRLKQAESDIDGLETAVGQSTDASTATTLFGRMKKAEEGLGLATDTANAAGTTAWSRILNAENDIDALQATVGASTDTAAADGTTLWARLKQAEADIDNLQAGLQVLLVSTMPGTVDTNTLYLLELE